MYHALAPCPGCRRHVRLSAAACPFCSASIAGAVAIPAATKRLGRGAVFAFASTVAIAGCGGSVNDPPSTDAATDAPIDTGSIGSLYGNVPTDTGPDDMGTIDAAYGAPVDTGGGGALYGAAPDK